MLAYQWHAKQGIPVVFLHGLLGSQQDWASVLALLQNFPQIRPLTLDLPCHHLSQHIGCQAFSDVRNALHQTLSVLIGEQPFYLVGYSLGGRIALDYSLKQENPYLRGALLEGANIGLNNQIERENRWQSDKQWAVRFENEPLETVLNDWYQQPVFAELSARKRAELVKIRQNNNGKKIAEMLLATSLAKQDFLYTQHENIRFVIGEQDLKFRQMAETHQLHYQLISQAGHNAHQANPQGFVDALVQFIR